VQTSIRLGRRLFDRHHPDFIPMKILDCVLGGYFGSRLMMNIREDKGYSYGIGSGVVSMDGSGYLYIATEVNKEAREAALSEIFLEMKRLRDKAIPDDELTTVTNYLGGMLQRSFDGPFSVAGSFRTVFLQQLGFEYYDRYQEALASMTPARLKELAAKYLVDDRFWSVTVG